MDFEKLGELEFKEEILRRFEVIEKTGALDFDYLNHNKTYGSFIDQETDQKDQEEFEQLRQELIGDVLMLNKKIKHKFDMKKIKKEVMKNMVEGPPILSSMISLPDTKKKAQMKESAAKNYHSDPENMKDINQKGKERSTQRNRVDSFEEE